MEHRETPEPNRDQATVDLDEEFAAADGHGQVLVVAEPWGKIEAILDSRDGSEIEILLGSPFTPKQIELPVGEYEIALSHSQAGRSTCRVEVTGRGSPTRCEAQLVEIDPRAFFEEMGW